MPVAMSEEQQVAIETQGVSPPGGDSLVDQAQLAKAPRPQALEHLLLLLWLYMFAVAIFF